MKLCILDNDTIDPALVPTYGNYAAMMERVLRDAGATNWTMERFSTPEFQYPDSFDAYDAVLLHTFFPDETLQRCVATVRESAAQAGRDPATVRVWSCLAVVGDWLPHDVRLKKTVGRMATYLQAYGDLMVRTNEWDPEVLARFRADPFVAGFRGALDGKATTAELEHVATLIPDEWLAAAGTGTPEQCAAAELHQLDLGADSVILHGAAPSELAPVVEAYRRLRPAGRFDHLAANPGRS